MGDFVDENFIEAERQRLFQELEERKEANKGKHDPYNFNNFYMKLRDAGFESDGWLRKLAIDGGSMDRPFPAEPNHSERLRQLPSRREFFRIIDELVEKFGPMRFQLFNVLG